MAAPAPKRTHDDMGNELCAVCQVPRYMHRWVTQPNRVWHKYAPPATPIAPPHVPIPTTPPAPTT